MTHLADKPIFYSPDLESGAGTIWLHPNEARHATGARRLREGDAVVLMNGNGAYRCGTLVRDGKRTGVVLTSAIAHAHDSAAEKQCAVHLVCAPPRGDRFGMLIDMATQIGIASFTPLHCEHGETRTPSAARIERRMVEACKQSRRLIVPALKHDIHFNDLVDDIAVNSEQTCTLIAHPVSDHERALQECVAAHHQHIFIVIGPEGGFTDLEIERADAAGFIKFGLGKPILRIETAAVAALSIVHERLRATESR